MAGERGQAGKARQVAFAVQDRLIQVRDAPALGNVEVKQAGQRFGRIGGHGVAPGAEFAQLLAVLVEGEIAVHHRGDAQGGEVGQLHAVPALHIGLERGIGILNAGPDVVHVVGPHAVFQAVFPGVIAGGDGRVILADEHALDARGAELEAQHRAAGLNDRGDVVHIDSFFGPER